MKKGMCVTLDNNESYIIIDSLTYNDDKYLAALLDNDDPQNETVKFFKSEMLDGEEYINVLNYEEYPEIIDALKQHIIASNNQEN